MLSCLCQSLRSYSAESGIKGLNFLSNARSRVEQFVWIIALLSAAVMTMRDVVKTVEAYQSGATVTSLRMKTQLPVQLKNLRICLFWTEGDLTTVDQPNWAVLGHLIEELSGNSSVNLTELENDFVKLDFHLLHPNNIPMALVAIITQYEIFGGNLTFRKKAETAYRLFLKLFPQATDNCETILRRIAVVYWSHLNLTLSTNRDKERQTLKPQFITWLGASTESEKYQACFLVDPDILKFRGRSSRIFISFDHSKLLKGSVFLSFYLGPSPFVGLEAENVFYPQLGRQSYLSIRHVGHYITKSTSESPCFEGGTSFSECLLTFWTQMINESYQCSPMSSALIDVQNLPFCDYRNLTNERNMSLPLLNDKCLQPCDRHMYTVDKDLSLNDLNCSFLNVNLASFIYPQFQEHLAMDFQILLGRLGGNLSLWLGASFLVLLHSFVFFLRLPFQNWETKITAKPKKDDFIKGEVDKLIKYLNHPDVIASIQAMVEEKKNQGVLNNTDMMKT